MTDQTQDTHQNAPVETRKTKIIRLLGEGMQPKAVAAVLDVATSYVYTINAQLRNGSVTARKPGRPKGSKAKAKPTQVVLKEVLKNLRTENEELRAQVEVLQSEAAILRQRPVTQYIEVEVPQPFSHYSFWQRLRILFLGRVA